MYSSLDDLAYLDYGANLLLLWCLLIQLRYDIFLLDY